HPPSCSGGHRLMKRSLLSMLFVPVILALTLAALPGAARPAYAAACSDDRRVMGENFTLAKGEQLDSNLIVMGGNATIEPGAVLNCTLVTVGGNVDIGGTVAEDMVVVGCIIQLLRMAVVGRQLVTFGGNMVR